MRLYLGCETDHVPPRDVDSPGLRASITAHICPVGPGEVLRPLENGIADWTECACCGSAWTLEDQGFACRPGRIVEEWE